MKRLVLSLGMTAVVVLMAAIIGLVVTVLYVFEGVGKAARETGVFLRDMVAYAWRERA